MDAKYFKKLIFIILATSMLPVLVFGVYATLRNSIALEEKVRQNNMSMLQNIQNNVDGTLTFIQNYYTLLMLYNDLGGWDINEINYSNIEPIEALQKDLVGGMLTYDLIKDAILINEEYDWAISHYKVHKLSTIPDYKETMELINEGGKIFWKFMHKSDNLGIEADLLQGNIRLVIKSITELTSKPKLAMVITLSNYQFIKLLRNNSSDYRVYVMDKEGVVIYDENTQNIGQKYTEAGILPGFDLEATDEVGYIADKKNGIYYNYIKSPTDRFIYSSAYTSDNIKAMSHSIVDFTLVLGVALTTVLLLLAYFESKAVYTPIKNEFEKINISLKDLLDKNTNMQLEIEQYRPMLEELFLTKLINEHNHLPEIEAIAKELNVFDKWVYMSILAVQIDTELEEALNHDILLLELCGNIRDIIPPEKGLKNIISNNCGVFLVGGNQEMLEDFMEELYTFGKRIVETAQKNQGINIQIGVSTVFADFMYSRKAFKESLNALLYKSILEHTDTDDNEAIIFFDDLKPVVAESREYPKALAEELREAIRNLDNEMISARLEEIINEIYSHRSVENEFQFYMLRLTSDIISTLDVWQDYTKIFNAERTVLELLSKILTPDDMRKFLMDGLITPIMDTIRENGGSQDAIIENILRIIHDEYLSDLSIEICAQRLNYHPTYIWRMMKNRLNTTFQDYLINYRMQAAKKWLVETDMTVLEISSKLRYNNSQNFIRAFKKTEGTTPGKYREENR